MRLSNSCTHDEHRFARVGASAGADVAYADRSWPARSFPSRSADAIGRWWGAWIFNVRTGVERQIGAIRVAWTKSLPMMQSRLILSGVRRSGEHPQRPRNLRESTDPTESVISGGVHSAVENVGRPDECNGVQSADDVDLDTGMSSNPRSSVQYVPRRPSMSRAANAGSGGATPNAVPPHVRACTGKPSGTLEVEVP